MRITKPTYYDAFRCLAGSCPDSCCKEWEVAVDDASAEYYRGLPGSLGDRLREVLRTEDGCTLMTIQDGRCPMWRTDGLCRIQAELGEAALCKTCREFPRLTHDYGDFAELGLELSCPEAARLILSVPDHRLMTEEVPGGEAPEYDTEAMAVLKRTRETVLGILADTGYSVGERLTLALLYGYQAQSELDGGDALSFDPEAALESARALAKPGDSNEILDFFLSLELLTPDWAQLLKNPQPHGWTEAYRSLARYFVERYWLQAVSDYDLYCRVKFCILSCAVIRLAGGELLPTAQLYSKEIENNLDNVEAILDAAYAHPAFTDDKLLALLLEG